MYSAVLLAALTAGSGAPDFWFHGCYGCYNGGCCGAYSCYGCYGAYASYGGNYAYGCYGCYGCGGCHNVNFTFSGYGCAGPSYGYAGGCYGGYGNWYGGGPYVIGMCGGCYGCHGGYSGYGIPVPNMEPPIQRPVDPYPPINPKKDMKVPEEVGSPKEKKSDTPKKDGKEPEEVGVPKEKKIDAPKKDQQSRAKIRIDLPAGAMLFVDGQRISAAAGSRVFQTPALAPGQRYFYDIRVIAERNGQTVSDEQRVVIQPGQVVTVAFPNLAPPTTETVQVNR